MSTNSKCLCTTCCIGSEVLPGPFTFKGNPVGRPRVIPKSPQSKTIPVCSKCLTVKMKGKPHECKKTTMEKNIPLIVKNRSKRGQGKITSNLLLSQAQDEGVSSRGGVVLLATGSKPLTVQVGKPKRQVRPTRFTVTDLRRLQRKFKFSGREIKGVAAAVRVVAGRKSVEVNMEKKMTIMNHEYDDLYYTKEIRIKVKQKIDEEEEFDYSKFLKELNFGSEENVGELTDATDDEPLSEEEGSENLGDGYTTAKKIGCFSDAEEILSCVMMKRGLTAEDVDVVCGIDGGQGSLKLCLQTVPKDGNNNLKKEKSKYSDGVAAKESILSSVNRLILLGLIPDCPENHHNIAVIMKELGMSGLEFLKSVDIKLVMILIGKSGGRPKFGCPFCDASYPFDKDGILYTLARLVELHEEYLAAGKPHKDQMKYENMTNPPIVTAQLNLNWSWCLT